MAVPGTMMTWTSRARRLWSLFGYEDQLQAILVTQRGGERFIYDVFSCFVTVLYDCIPRTKRHMKFGELSFLEILLPPKLTGPTPTVPKPNRRALMY